MGNRASCLCSRRLCRCQRQKTGLCQFAACGLTDEAVAASDDGNLHDLLSPVFAIGRLARGRACGKLDSQNFPGARGPPGCEASDEAPDCGEQAVTKSVARLGWRSDPRAAGRDLYKLYVARLVCLSACMSLGPESAELTQPTRAVALGLLVTETGTTGLPPGTTVDRAAVGTNGFGPSPWWRHCDGQSVRLRPRFALPARVVARLNSAASTPN